MKSDQVNKHASALIHLRWAKMSPEERSAAVPRTGRRPCIYPPCTRKKYHRWKNGICRFCGMLRETAPATPPEPLP